MLIRPVRYRSAPGRSMVEVTTVANLRRRGGTSEFLAPQRIDFELVIALDQGSTVHEVDFIRHALIPGDVLWVHSGQVQRWGKIDEIEGNVILAQTSALPAGVTDLLGSTGALRRNYWPGAVAHLDSPISTALRGLAQFTTALTGDPINTAVHTPAVEYAVASALFTVAGTAPMGSIPERVMDQRYRDLLDALEEHFPMQRSAQWYADELGYSTRTLNRLTQTHAGITVKELIDQRVVLEAKRLLTYSSQSVAAIAMQLGFDDAANFSRYVRERIGMSPGAFRDQQRRRH